MSEQELTEQSGSRQAVVFVRINNMATLEVERQETFVIDLDPSLSLDETISEALDGAGARSRSYRT